MTLPTGSRGVNNPVSANEEDDMDEARARELLAQRRADVEDQLRTVGIDPLGDDESTTEIADNASDTYQAEYDAGRIEELRAELEAVDRAEERLRSGTFGLSVESGEPIPDERLEALPTAERTVEEEQARDGRR
jgi:DnaK suppressor protein